MKNKRVAGVRAAVATRTIWGLLKLLKYLKYLKYLKHLKHFRSYLYYFRKFRNTPDPLQRIIGAMDRLESPVDFRPMSQVIQSRIQSHIQNSAKGLSAKQLQILNSAAAAVVVTMLVTGLKTLVPERPTDSKSDCALPTPAQFVLILLSPKRRADVLNDILDWYPAWMEKHGRRLGALLCLIKIAEAVAYQVLDLLYRVGEVVGKFRGAK